MKHRVRIDLSFDNDADAKALLVFAKTLTGKAASLNEGNDNAEMSFAEYHLCYHDEEQTRPCEVIERVEVKEAAVLEPIER